MMLGQTRQQGIHRSGGRILPPPVVTEIPEPLLTAPVTEWPDCFLDTVDLVDETGASVHALRGGERLSLQLSGRIDKSDPSLNAGFIFKDRLGQALFGALTDVTLNAHCDADGSFEARFIFDLPMLRAGDFSFTAILASQCDHSLIVRARRDEAFVVRLDPQRVTHGLLPIPVEVDYRVVSRVHNFRKSES
ncbi:MAG: Wzt carbohydrate-binding domain-containing protein [Ferrovum myxofaciens]